MPEPEQDELAALCLSYLKPPSYKGGSWTLNPTALADAIRARYTLDPINADHRWREVDGGPGMLGSRQCTDCGLWYGRWLGDGCPKRGFAVDEPAS
jgi:hypothetical protein